MKYLYKGLELGGEGEGINCAVLLGWHERVSAPPTALQVRDFVKLTLKVSIFILTLDAV